MAGFRQGHHGPLVSALFLWVAMAVGITQPGGAGTTIFYYDNASAPDATAYHFADFAAAFPADFVDNGTTPKTYRAKVSLQCGDTGVGTASTTLQDTDVGVWFDTAKVLLYRTTSPTSWTTNFGVKVGSGNIASGRNGCKIYVGGATTFRGNWGIYGSIIESQGAGLNFTPATSGVSTELVDCIIGNKGTGTTSLIALGTASVALSNVYNVDFWGNIASASLGLFNNFNMAHAERISITINAAGYFIRSAQTTLAVKDLLLFGTPAVADFAKTGAGTVVWTLVNIRWSRNAPKFDNITAVAGDITEYRLADSKIVNAAGTGIPDISVVLIDAVGTTQINTVTDANGRINFGSGITTNAVAVQDHYGTVSYLTRDRSPFLVQINVTNPNSAYAQIPFYFDWPTDADGLFEDTAVIVPLQAPSGFATPWREYELGVWP